MNELQMQNIGGIDYHLKDQYARDIIATSENGLDSQSDLPVSSRPYTIGEYLIDQNRLYYEVIDTISTGDVLVVGINIKRTTVSAEINKLKGNSAIMAIEIVAPIEDALLSTREYQEGDSLYWLNEHLSGLYNATMHIVIGDALIIGTNIKPAKKIAKSVKDINDEISDMTGILGAKNLCPNNASTVTQSGVTYTVNADGSVKISGTATANNALELGIITIPKGIYKITTGQTQEQNASQLLFVQRTSDNVVIGRSSDSVGGALGEFTLDSDTEVRFSLWSDNGRTGVVTLYPMCKPVTIMDESYVPYAPTNRELSLEVSHLASQIADLTSFVNPSSIQNHTISGGFTSGFALHVQIGKLVIVNYSCLYTGGLVPNNQYSPFISFPIPISSALSTINEQSLGTKTRYEVKITNNGYLTITPANTITNDWLQGQLIYICD